MTLRVALLGAAAVTLLLMFGPLIVVRVIHRPLVVDCGGIEPAACDQMWRNAAHTLRRQFGYAGPVTYARLEPIAGTCSAVTVERYWFTFGFTGYGTQPQC